MDIATLVFLKRFIKDDELVGTSVASYKETIEDSRCQWNKEAMKQKLKL